MTSGSHTKEWAREAVARINAEIDRDKALERVKELEKRVRELEWKLQEAA